MSEAKESSDKKLGIDVVINFEGIEKIVQTLQDKVNIALAGQTYHAQTIAEVDVSRIRESVDDMKNKLIEFISRKIPTTTYAQPTLAGGFGSTADVEASLPSSMDYMRATTPQKLLNQFALDNMRKILDEKEDEKKDPFVNMELTAGYLGTFVKAWKGRKTELAKDRALRKAIEKDSKTIFSEQEILYKEILRAIQYIESKQERLTTTGVLRILQSRQLGREGKVPNPYAYSELGSTKNLRILHKDIINTAKEAIKATGADDITTEESIDIIEKAQERISRQSGEAIEETVIGQDVTTRIEAAGLARNTILALESVKKSLDITAKKGQKEIKKIAIERIEKNKVLLVNTSKKIDDLQNDIKEIKTFSDFMALKTGGEVLDIMSKKLNEIISDDKTQQELKGKIVLAFQRAAELGSGDAMKSVAKYIKEGLDKETKIKEVAKRFNDVYAPIFESLSDSMSKLQTEDLWVIDKFSQVAESLETIGSTATASLRVIDLLSNLNITEDSANIIEETIMSFETRKIQMDDIVQNIKGAMNTLFRKGIDLNDKIKAIETSVDKGYFKVSDYANAIKRMTTHTEEVASRLDSAKNRSIKSVDEVGEKAKELEKSSKTLATASVVVTSLTAKLTEEMKDFREVRNEIIEGVVEGVERQIVNSLINRLNDKFEGESG